jgi:hypothetical protein
LLLVLFALQTGPKRLTFREKMMLTIKSEKQGVKKHVLWAETFDISRKNDANETYILPPLNAAHTTIVSTSQFSQCTGTHPHAQIVSSSGHCEAYKSASTCDQQRRKKINHWRQALMLSTGLARCVGGGGTTCRTRRFLPNQITPQRKATEPRISLPAAASE